MVLAVSFTPCVRAPEMLPAETRRAVLSGVRAHSVKLTAKTTPLKPNDDDEEF